MFTNEFIKNNTPTPAAKTGDDGPFFKPAVQRKDAAQPPPLNVWRPDMVNITVFDNNRVGNCFGISAKGEQLRLSSCTHWPSCREFNIALLIEFYIDRVNAPHPGPIQPGPVSVDISYTPTGQQAKSLYKKTDPNPVYRGPNQVLLPSFGKSFPVHIDTDGTLDISVSLDDGAGTQVAYHDSAKFVVLCT